MGRWGDGGDEGVGSRGRKSSSVSPAPRASAPCPMPFLNLL
ncbi:hypothetical protein [Nostoc linckia]|nr:hypothetical protein [Nostoc linckia]